MLQELITNKLIKKCFSFTMFLMFLLLANINLKGQDSGSILIKTFKPGGADLSDKNIDKKALAFVDSLMKRDDIEVQFLGASDNLKWKQSKNVKEISNAWDQAKKLERASRFRERYGKGEIGTTDESFRGVKVVWGPKKPDIFKLEERVTRLEDLTDSLLALNSEKQQEIVALEDTLINRETNININTDANISVSYFDWEVKTGFLYWTAGNPYDLAIPFIGIALKRQSWAFELQGGLTPWSQAYSDGDRSDAFLMGTMNLFPENLYEFKVGIFSGWEFFTNSDNWTMKAMGITAGPNIHWKFLETYIGYNLNRLSTLISSTKWVHSGIIAMSFNIKLNKN